MKLIRTITSSFLILLSGFMSGYAQGLTISGSCVSNPSTLVLGGDPDNLTYNGKSVYYNSSVSLNFESTIVVSKVYLYFAMAAELGTAENRWVISYDGQPYYYFISNDASAPYGDYLPFDTSLTEENCGGSINVSFNSTITLTANLEAFTYCQGSPSTSQSFTVSGADLTENITITAPTGFEVSTSSDSGYASSITLTQSEGTVSSTTVYIRVASTATGSPSGNILVSSDGVSTQSIAVSATLIGPQCFTVTQLWTDFGGFWTSSSTAINPVKPNNSHDLLAFKMGSSVYSTGADDAKLSTNGVQFMPQVYKAIPFSSMPTSGTAYFAGFGQLYDGINNGLKSGLFTASSGYFASLLTDGKNGLDIGTGLANVPVATLSFTLSSNGIDPESIDDGIPDLLFVQIATPGTGDKIKFVKADGTTVGIEYAFTLSDLTLYPELAKWQADFYGISGSSLTNVERPLSILAVDVSALGITKSNYTQVDKIIYTTSGSADPAVIAYREQSISIASALSITSQPKSYTSTADLGSSITVQIIDGLNLSVDQPNTPITVSIESGNGTLSGTLTRNTDANGLATFDDLKITGSGIQKLRFSASGLTSAVSLELFSCNTDQTVNTDVGQCNYVHSGTDWDPAGAESSSLYTFGYELSGETQGAGVSLDEVSFNLGTTTVTWTATGESGNFEICSFTVTVNDEENPTVTAPDDVEESTDPGECTAEIDIADADFGDNCADPEIAWVMTGATEDDGEGQIGTYTFSLGITTVTYTVTDASGNTATDSFTVTVNDEEDPTVTAPDDVEESTDLGECIAEIDIADADFGDNCADPEIAWVMTGATEDDGEGHIGSYTFNKGVTTVTYTVTDASGNTATDSFTVTVNDEEDPTVTAPDDVEESTDPGECTAEIDITDADFGDNCSDPEIAWEMTGATEADGEGQIGTYTFNKGVTTVTYTVTDASGNTATDSFTVTVNDEEDPTLTCVSNKTKNSDAGEVFYTAIGSEFDLITYGDNCQISTVSYRLKGVTDSEGFVESTTLEGVEFNFGETTVTWKVIDTSGNEATCSFTVNVTNITTITGIEITPLSSGESEIPSFGNGQPVQQYSDKIKMEAMVTPWPDNPTEPLEKPKGRVVYYIGTEKMGIAEVGDGGIATLTVPLLELKTELNYSKYNSGQSTTGPLKPGLKNVSAEFISDELSDPVYLGSESEATLEITKENASVVVDNTDSYFTVNPTSFKGTVWFKANIYDQDDSSDSRGDIRNATIQFKDGASGTGSPIGPPRNVGLIDPKDKTMGVSLYTFEYTLNNSEIASGGKSWIEWAEAGNYYEGQDRRDMNIVTLALPGSEYVTGGGYFAMQQSGGLYAGTQGKRLNFGFNMKWNKSGKNLQGQLNVIFRREVDGQTRIYQIKSNAIDMLSVSSTSLAENGTTHNFNTSTMTSKANLTDITDPLNPISLGGNMNLKIVAWDNKAQGSAGRWDKISIELLHNSTSQLLFSSHLVGSQTQVLNLNGGNINIRNVSPDIPVSCTAPVIQYPKNSEMTDSSPDLTWSSVDGALGYTIQYRLQGGSWYAINTDQTNYTLTGLVPGSVYEWTVQSVCANGTSVVTSATFRTELDCAAAPGGLMVSLLDNVQAKVEWASSGAGSYEISWRIRGSLSEWSSVITNANYYTITDLSAETGYEWRIRNICNEGEYGEYSNLYLFTTLSNCADPEGLNVGNISASGATFHWNDIGTASSYTLRFRKVDSGEDDYTIIPGINTNAFTIFFLEPLSSYEWSVMAVCADGTYESDFAENSYFSTLSLCPTPLGTQTESITNSSATLKWSSVSGAITYVVQWRIFGSENWNTIEDIGQNSYILSALQSGERYEWRVQASCSGDTGTWSSTQSFTTTLSSVCSPELLISNPASTSGTTAVLSWDGPEGAVYLLEYRKAGAKNWTRATNATAPFTLTKLSRDTLYEWKVTATCNGLTGLTVVGENFTTSISSASNREISSLEMNTEIQVRETVNVSVIGYPNPILNGNFTISLIGFEEGEVGISVISSNGVNLIEKTEFIRGKNPLVNMSISEFARGVYFVRVRQGTILKILKMEW
jgi:hypothetical protein